jgi:formylglycine-generating enzyme required for sulfatase activity
MNEPLNDSTYLDMAEIPAGSFLMGSPPEEEGRYSDEGPQHAVSLSAFFLSRTPITQAQWRAVASFPKVDQDLDPDPSYFKGDNLPVEHVSWKDAIEFCARLSQRSGRNYTLPSEAQWEYACRAGTTTRFSTGDTITTNQANFDGAHVPIDSDQEVGDYKAETTTVGMFPANAWGLYDMHGNVWEWCLDDWHSNYEGAPTDGSAWIEGNRLGKSGAADPGHPFTGAAAQPTDACLTDIVGQVLSDFASALEANSLGKLCEGVPGSAIPSSAARPSGSASTRLTAGCCSATSLGFASAFTLKLLRGGSWYHFPSLCRSACRYRGTPDNRADVVGFRVCCLHETALP